MKVKSKIEMKIKKQARPWSTCVWNMRTCVWNMRCQRKKRLKDDIKQCWLLYSRVTILIIVFNGRPTTLAVGDMTPSGFKIYFNTHVI